MAGNCSLNLTLRNPTDWSGGQGLIALCISRVWNQFFCGVPLGTRTLEIATIPAGIRARFRNTKVFSLPRREYWCRRLVWVPLVLRFGNVTDECRRLVWFPLVLRFGNVTEMQEIGLIPSVLRFAFFRNRLLDKCREIVCVHSDYYGWQGSPGLSRHCVWLKQVY